MGTLGGHLLPGSFFAMFAIWWGFITSLRYVQQRHYAKMAARKGAANGGGGIKQNRATEASGTYKTTVWMPCICLPCGPRSRRAPIECWMKAILAFIALVIEAYTAVSFQVRIQLIKNTNYQLIKYHRNIKISLYSFIYFQFEINL